MFLQYLLGFRQLGWRVLFVDEIAPESCVDEAGRRCAFEESLNAQSTIAIMQRFGLGECYALHCGEAQLGLERKQVIEHLRDSAFLLNVMGFLRDEELLAAAPRRVFLDIDPGFGQMWRELGLSDIFAGHDQFVTIGENIGKPDCEVPTCGIEWITTFQPVVLEYCPEPEAPVYDGFTTIANWRGYGSIEHERVFYGQ